MTHEVELTSYRARCDTGILKLGTAGSYGVEKLHIVRNDAWINYDITAVFYPVRGTPVEMRADISDIVAVPPEASAKAGIGKIVFNGYSCGIRQLSCNLLFRITETDQSGEGPVSVTPDLIEQILSAANQAERNSVIALQAVPLGGKSGQVLAKVSDRDRDTAWITIGGSGESSGKIDNITANGVPLPLVNGTVNIPAATTEAFGLVRPDGETLIAEDGVLKIKSISISNLTVPTDTELILDCGQA